MTTVYDFSMKTLDGVETPLAKYKGRVLLIVNVASKCGLTPQYRALEALHESLGPRGLSVLGVPSNDFGRQEPGTEAEIRAFCTTNYGVQFDMFAKVPVTGPDAHPLYAHLTAPDSRFAGPIGWNFTKFLVGRDGTVLARFEPTVAPDAPELRAAIESALAS